MHTPSPGQPEQSEPATQLDEARNGFPGPLDVPVGGNGTERLMSGRIEGARALIKDSVRRLATYDEAAGPAESLNQEIVVAVRKQLSELGASVQGQVQQLSKIAKLRDQHENVRALDNANDTAAAAVKALGSKTEPVDLAAARTQLGKLDGQLAKLVPGTPAGDALRGVERRADFRDGRDTAAQVAMAGTLLTLFAGVVGSMAFFTSETLGITHFTDIRR